MKSFRINLIEKSQGSQVELTHEFGIILSGACVLLIMILTTGFQFYKKSQYNNELVELQQKNSEILQKIAVLQTQDQNADRATLLISSLNEILGKKLNWSEVFKELSTIIPKDVWISSFETKFENGSWSLSFKGSSPSQTLVSQFFSLMENSYHFSNAMIQYSQKKDKIAPNLYEFEIKVPLRHIAKVARDEP